MKRGVRAVGLAESFRSQTSTLAAAVVRADRVVDGFGFDTCTVGGTDATQTIQSVLIDLEREDIGYVMLGAVAPAWYNIVDLQAVAETLEIPVLAVTFEASSGLESAIRSAFDGAERADRLERYRSLPEREPVQVGNGETVYVRAVDLSTEEAATVVKAFTPSGGRPEPLRVARLAARAANRL
ncbi:MAG: DUF99 family protein [Natrialbaceae archaeon]|nr:DUF99 family protein [Natrialbaceae archaeon]